MGRGAAATTLAQMGCSGDEAAAAVVEVDEHRALLPVWSPSRPALEVVLEANGSIRSRSMAWLDDDGTGVARLADLEPGTTHRAIVTAGGTELFERTFSTAPAADDTRDVRLAVVADVDVGEDMRIFDLVAAAGADLTVSLGDFPYVDEPGQRFISAPEKILERHVEARTAPALQSWLSSTSVRGIYDDHEVCNNWGGNKLRGNEIDECHVALSIWDGFFPRHDPEGPRYRSWRWGANVECFLLDTRCYRSHVGLPDDASKSMLGIEQRQWLLDGVTSSAATFKIVLSTVPLDFGNGNDHWSGYRTERDMILDAFARAGTSGLLVISGDQHWFAAHVHRHGVREFQIGPAAARLFAPPPATAGVIHREVERNFGLVDIGSRSLRFRSISSLGRTLYDEEFTSEDLRVEDPTGVFK